VGKVLDHLAAKIAEQRAERARAQDPLAGLAPMRPRRWSTVPAPAALAPEISGADPLAGFPTDPHEVARLQAGEEASAAGSRAAADYSPLPDELGWLVPPAAVAGDVLADQRLIDPERHDRIARGVQQAGRDVLDTGAGGAAIDALAAIPEAMRHADAARRANPEPPSALELALQGGLWMAPDAARSAAGVAEGLWQGWPQAGRDARRRAAEADSMADFEARDAALTRAAGGQAFPWAERVARQQGDRAHGDDFWTTGPAALEFVPEAGLISGLTGPAARRAGANLPRAIHEPPGPLTAELRDAALVAGGDAALVAGGGAVLAADQDPGDLDPLSAVAAGAIGARIVGPILSRAIDFPAPPEFALGVPETAMGARQSTRTGEGARRAGLRAAVRDPESGAVYAGANHWEALDSAPDDVRARLSAAYEADANGPDIGYTRGQDFLTRDEAMAQLGANVGGEGADPLAGIGPPPGRVRSYKERLAEDRARELIGSGQEGLTLQRASVASGAPLRRVREIAAELGVELPNAPPGRAPRRSPEPGGGGGDWMDDPALRGAVSEQGPAVPVHYPPGRPRTYPPINTGFDDADLVNSALARDDLGNAPTMDTVAEDLLGEDPSPHQINRLKVHRRQRQMEARQAIDAGDDAVDALASRWNVTPDRLREFAQLERQRGFSLRREARKLIAEGVVEPEHLIAALRERAERARTDINETSLRTTATNMRAEAGLTPGPVDNSERNARIMQALRSGLSYPEAARELGLSVGTVLGVGQRARKRGDWLGGVALGALTGGALASADDAQAFDLGDAQHAAEDWWPWLAGGAALSAGALALRGRGRGGAGEVVATPMEAASPERAMAAQIVDTLTPRERDQLWANIETGRPPFARTAMSLDALDEVASPPQGTYSVRGERRDKPSVEDLFPNGQPLDRADYQYTLRRLNAQRDLTEARQPGETHNVEVLARQYGTLPVHNPRTGKIDRIATLRQIFAESGPSPRQIARAGEDDPLAGVRLDPLPAARASDLRSRGVWAVDPASQRPIAPEDIYSDQALAGTRASDLAGDITGATGLLRQRPPPTLSVFARRYGEARSNRGGVVRRGGIGDDRGDIGAIDDAARGYARMTNASSGEPLDAAITAAWEAGYFPDHADPPTATEFIDSLAQDIRGANVIAADDLSQQAARDQAQGFLDEMAAIGVDTSLRGRALIEELRRHGAKAALLSVGGGAAAASSSGEEDPLAGLSAY
jgi:hypothetical protein